MEDREIFHGIRSLKAISLDNWAQFFIKCQDMMFRLLKTLLPGLHLLCSTWTQAQSKNYMQRCWNNVKLLGKGPGQVLERDSRVRRVLIHLSMGTLSKWPDLSDTSVSWSLKWAVGLDNHWVTSSVKEARCLTHSMYVHTLCWIWLHPLPKWCNRCQDLLHQLRQKEQKEPRWKPVYACWGETINEDEKPKWWFST